MLWSYRTHSGIVTLARVSLPVGTTKQPSALLRNNRTRTRYSTRLTTPTTPSFSPFPSQLTLALRIVLRRNCFQQYHKIVDSTSYLYKDWLLLLPLPLPLGYLSPVSSQLTPALRIVRRRNCFQQYHTIVDSTSYLHKGCLLLLQCSTSRAQGLEIQTKVQQ